MEKTPTLIQIKTRSLLEVITGKKKPLLQTPSIDGCQAANCLRIENWL